MVYQPRDVRRCPYSLRSLILLDPRLDVTVECHLAAVDQDDDRAGIDRRVTNERCADALLHVDGGRTLRQLDTVAHPPNPDELFDRSSGQLALEVPLDVSAEDDGVVDDLSRDARETVRPIDDVLNVRGDLGVAVPADCRVADGDLVGDGGDALYPERGVNGGESLREGADLTAEGDAAVMDGDTDLG